MINRLTIMRRAKGLSQRDLAKRLNVSVKTVSRMECGERKHPERTSYPIANGLQEIFGEPIEQLLQEVIVP